MKLKQTHSRMGGWALSSLLALQISCGQPSVEDSSVDVTSVRHTAVKQQSIGNCWIYAHATWLESMLLNTRKEAIDVSETYWTYWDLFNKIISGTALDKDGKVSTGGNWWMSSKIIQEHGWVEEGTFLKTTDGRAADTSQMSAAQKCAEDYLVTALKEGGSLHQVDDAALIHEGLQKGFSCNGRYLVNLNPDGSKPETLPVQNASDTELVSIKDPNQSLPLSEWILGWRSISPLPIGASGKSLPSEDALQAANSAVQRVMQALNDGQPVVMSFHVSFNAPNSQGVFNNYSLAKAGSMGNQGGHMVVLHDYTVTDVPGVADGRLPEGNLSPEEKALALQGKPEMLVAKNSWGSNRWDRPWIRDGFSRFSWDHLTSYYHNESTSSEDKKRIVFSPFIQSFILPPGY